MYPYVSKPYVAALLPVGGASEELYHAGVLPACERAGACAECLGGELFTGNSLDLTLAKIARADAVVADLTGRDPNVCYAAGFAHARGQEVILLTHETGDLPAGWPNHVYLPEGTLPADLIPALAQRLRQAFAPTLPAARQGLTLHYDGAPLVDGTTISVRSGAFYVPLAFTVRNESDSLQKIQYRVGFFTSPAVKSCTFEQRSCEMMKVRDGRRLYLIPHVFSARPYASQIVPCYFTVDRPYARPGREHLITLRLDSDLGISSTTFSLHYEQQRLSLPSIFPTERKDHAPS